MKPFLNFNTLLLLIFFSCEKNSPAPTTNSDLTDATPPQYGTPFMSVPDRQDVVMYQVNIRAFSNKGNFAGVIARLDSIKALGVNVIYLMPIYPIGQIRSINSPYCVRDYRAVNHEFGTLNDLRALVDSAHSKRMSVILDWVANHTSWDNAWINTNKSWYVQGPSGDIISPNGWNDVAQLNFNNSSMRLQMIRNMKYWVFTANIDGFRCDYADGPPDDFWKQAIDSLRGIKTRKLLLLAEGSRSSNYASGFDFNFGFSFYHTLKSIYANNSSVQLIDNINNIESDGAVNGQKVVRYITNHDVNSSDGTPLDLFNGKNGSKAAFVVAALMNSVPMIYNGEEVGMSSSIKFPFTSVKIDWTVGQDMTDFYKKVIAIRNNSNAIRRGNVIPYSDQDVCVFIKQKELEKVLVIINLRNKSVDYSLPSSFHNTSWTDAINGEVKFLSAKLTLQPYSYYILRN
jgi:glycosidase